MSAEPLTALHLEAENFARLAFRKHLKRPAAHFTVRGEPLRCHTGIDDQVGTLAAEGTLDGFGNLHCARKLRRGEGFEQS